jgi:hypothetical protein
MVNSGDVRFRFMTIIIPFNLAFRHPVSDYKSKVLLLFSGLFLKKKRKIFAINQALSELRETVSIFYFYFVDNILIFLLVAFPFCCGFINFLFYLLFFYFPI